MAEVVATGVAISYSEDIYVSLRDSARFYHLGIEYDKKKVLKKSLFVKWQ
jgi:hypothetical protein